MLFARLTACLLASTVLLVAASNRGPAIALRKRVHINPLITEPGTFEIEWGGAFSTGGAFTFPSLIKYTPEGHHIWWGRTEFSVGFDSLNSAIEPERRITHFGDRATIAANCVVHDGDKFDFAIAPQGSFLLRGDSGMRAGVTAIARYDWGKNSAGTTLTWTGATRPSDSNPAGTLDLGGGFGRHLATQGPLGHLTAHTNWLIEKSTGVTHQISVFEGVEYQVTDKVAVDFSAQHFSVWGGGPIDHQAVIGLTINFGRLFSK